MTVDMVIIHCYKYYCFITLDNQYGKVNIYLHPFLTSTGMPWGTE